MAKIGVELLPEANQKDWENFIKIGGTAYKAFFSISSGLDIYSSKKLSDEIESCNKKGLRTREDVDLYATAIVTRLSLLGNNIDKNTLAHYLRYSEQNLVTEEKERTELERFTQIIEKLTYLSLYFKQSDLRNEAFEELIKRRPPREKDAKFFNIFAIALSQISLLSQDSFKSKASKLLEEVSANDSYFHALNPKWVTENLPKSYVNIKSLKIQQAIEQACVQGKRSFIERACFLSPNEVIPPHLLDENFFSNFGSNLQKIADLGLLEEERGTYRISEKIQVEARQFFSKNTDNKILLDLALGLYKAWSFNENSSDKYSPYQRTVQPHIESFVKNVEKHVIPDGPFSLPLVVLFNKLGLYHLFIEKDPKTASVYFEKALTYIPGINQENVSLKNWALPEKKEIEFYLKFSYYQKEHFDLTAPEFKLSQGNIGNKDDLEGKHQTKEHTSPTVEFYRRSLEIQEKIYGENHPNVAITLHKLGLTYHALGGPKQAIDCLNQALQINKKNYKKDHPILELLEKQLKDISLADLKKQADEEEFETTSEDDFEATPPVQSPSNRLGNKTDVKKTETDPLDPITFERSIRKCKPVVPKTRRTKEGKVLKAKEKPHDFLPPEKPRIPVKKQLDVAGSELKFPVQSPSSLSPNKADLEKTKISPLLSKSIASSIFDPKAPWEISPELANRVNIKPFQHSGHFKKCLILESDPEMKLIKSYFEASKPEGFEIKRAYCIENSDSVEQFKSTLRLIEESIGSAQSEQIKTQQDSTKEIVNRWKSLTKTFDPSQTGRMGAVPLWHGSSLENSKSIASSGFASFGKHEFVKSLEERGIASNPKYLESGIHFTDSARYASSHGSDVLILSWISLKDPSFFIDNIPISDPNQETKPKPGEAGYQPYKTCYVSSGDEPSRDYHHDEFIVFEKGQTLPRFWIELQREGTPKAYTLEEAFACAEEGNLTQLKDWIHEDPKRLQEKNLEGQTLLYAALSGNQLETIESIHGFDKSIIDKVRDDGRSFPFLAVLGGRKEILNWLVKERILYSASTFKEEAKNFGYSEEKIRRALKSVGLSFSNLPGKPPHFIERTTDLSEIESQFYKNKSEENPCSFIKVVLMGYAGIGKTDLAAAYATKWENDYSFVEWISIVQQEPKPGSQKEKGESNQGRSELASALKSFATERISIKNDASDDEILKATRDYLSNHKGWLLVFDGLETSHTDSFVELFRNFTGEGNVLITTRNSNAKALSTTGDALLIGPFSSDESIQLLAKITGREDDAGARSLAEKLGHIPIALSKAGTYIVKTNSSYKQCEQIISGQASTHLDPEAEKFLKDLSEVWVSALKKLRLPDSSEPVPLERQVEDPPALVLLKQIAFSNSDEINKSDLNQNGSLKLLDFNKGLKLLKEHGFLLPGKDIESVSINYFIRKVLETEFSRD